MEPTQYISGISNYLVKSGIVLANHSSEETSYTSTRYFSLTNHVGPYNFLELRLFKKQSNDIAIILDCHLLNGDANKVKAVLKQGAQSLDPLKVAIEIHTKLRTLEERIGLGNI